MSSQYKILVVDDNALNRALAEDTLGSEGYAIILAANGAEALSAFHEHDPDCVLLDVRMPGADGPSVCAELRRSPNGADVPIVFCTAQRDVDSFDRALAAGGDDFLTKPVQPSELILRVQAALKLRQMKFELREHYALVRRQRDDLMRLQLQKERLSQFVVHDLKNPVGTLDLSAQQLLRNPDLSEDARRIVTRMRGDVRALLRMIFNLLDINQSDGEGLRPRCEPISLRVMIRELFAESEVKAQSALVTLVASTEDETLYADPALLRRVLDNLLDNALRHAPEQSEIRVSSARVAGAVELRIADQGSGVAAAARAQIFEPYVQLDSSSSERSGRGLGLAFCKLAVEAHGGGIWVEDGQPGAVFCVSLPEGRG